MVPSAGSAVAHRRCTTRRCGRLWAEHHRPRFVYTAFELCVANRESGSTGSTSFGAIDWRYGAPGDPHKDYEGAFNWVNSTWLAMGGGRYAKHAYDATPEQQTRIFRAHANSRDWPLTVPACGG